MIEPSFTYVVVASILQDEADQNTNLEAFANVLRQAGGSAGEISCKNPVMFLVLTGGTEQQVLDLVAERQSHNGDEPVLLLAHRNNNSLAACLEILARIRRDGGKGEITLLDEEPASIERLRVAARALCCRQALRTSTIGVIGEPSDWLVASNYTRETVRTEWGPKLLSIPVHELRQRLQCMPDDPDGGVAIAAEAKTCVEPIPQDLAAAASITTALRELIADYKLDAFTLRCFDLVIQDRLTACHALSRLADDGIPAGCEGDIPSVLGLLWVKTLLGSTGWMANPTWIDPGRGEVHLAHCTVPRSLVSKIDLRSHFESGLGVAIQGELRLGPVTLIRIGGKRLEELWLAEGELIATPQEENCCRTQAVIRCEPARVSTLLSAPLGNHVVMVEGYHEESLRASRG